MPCHSPFLPPFLPRCIYFIYITYFLLNKLLPTIKSCSAHIIASNCTPLSFRYGTPSYPTIPAIASFPILAFKSTSTRRTHSSQNFQHTSLICTRNLSFPLFTEPSPHTDINTKLSHSIFTLTHMSRNDNFLYSTTYYSNHLLSTIPSLVLKPPMPNTLPTSPNTTSSFKFNYLT